VTENTFQTVMHVKRKLNLFGHGWWCRDLVKSETVKTGAWPELTDGTIVLPRSHAYSLTLFEKTYAAKQKT